MAESGDSAKSQRSGTYVRVGYPIDVFEHGVSGVQDPLTTEWSEEPVSDPKVKELRKVAKANSVPLAERSSKPGGDS